MKARVKSQHKGAKSSTKTQVELSNATPSLHYIWAKISEQSFIYLYFPKFTKEHVPMGFHKENVLKFKKWVAIIAERSFPAASGPIWQYFIAPLIWDSKFTLIGIADPVSYSMICKSFRSQRNWWSNRSILNKLLLLQYLSKNNFKTSLDPLLNKLLLLPSFGATWLASLTFRRNLCKAADFHAHGLFT